MYYTKCICGAITIQTDDGMRYMSKKIKKFMPQLDLRKVKRYQTTVMCDYCVNNYGLELCGCGSGELFGQCDNNEIECQKPMQCIGEYDRVIAVNGW